MYVVGSRINYHQVINFSAVFGDFKCVPRDSFPIKNSRKSVILALSNVNEECMHHRQLTFHTRYRVSQDTATADYDDITRDHVKCIGFSNSN